MSIRERLQDLGLTPTEATIYLAGYKRAGIDIQSLIKETDLKRPTIYHALETLVQKGLVAKSGSEKKRLFVMASPERLGGYLDTQIQQLTSKKALLGELGTLLTKSDGRSSGIRSEQYDGLQGVKTVMEEALYCKSRTWSIIAPARNILSGMDPEYQQYYLRQRSTRGIKTRTLWEQKSTPGKRGLSPADLALRNPRYLPKALQGRFPSMIILFDEKIAFFGTKEAPSAVLITFAELHALVLAMFDGIWEVSEPYKN